MSRATLAAGELPNNPGFLSGWIADPQHIKPGSLMPDLELSGPDLASIRSFLADAEVTERGMTIAEYERVPRVVERRTTSRLSRARSRRSGRPSRDLSAGSRRVDHKEIGIRYIVTAFAFLIVGGLEALIMRLQLARPEPDAADAGAVRRAVLAARHHDDFSLRVCRSSRASAIICFRWCSARGTWRFPRLNAFSYWVYLASGFSCMRACSWRRRRTTAGSTMFPTR